MAKWFKKVMGVAAVGTAIAGLVYYFNNKNTGGEDDEFSEEFDDEDFNLDEDLKPASDREYVPLNQTAKADSDTKAETTAEDTADAAQTKTEDTVKEDKTETSSGTSSDTSQ